MPISPESLYCLDGAMMLLDITADIVYGTSIGQIDVDGIVDDPSLPFAQTVTDRVLAWRATASPKARAWMALPSLIMADETMREFRWDVLGHIAEEFLRQHGYPDPVNIYGHSIAAPRIPLDLRRIRALRSAEVFEASLALQPKLAGYIESLRQQHARTVEAFRSLDGDYDAMRQGMLDFIRQEQAETPRPRLGPTRRQRRQNRKAVWRSVQTMTKLVAPDAYHSFISNEGYVITGHLFDYHVKKKHNLLETADSHHIPYLLHIRSKDGTILGSGCVVFEDSPVLDQVVALTLHVRDREAEITLLKTTNWTLTEHGRTELQAFITPPPREETEDDETIRTLLARARQSLFNTAATRHYYNRRSRIMRALTPYSVGVLADMSGIPRPIFHLMNFPGEHVDLTAKLQSAELGACVALMRNA